MSNPCINCGKERVDGKTWEEKLGATVVIRTQTICPDSECQKVVDEGIARQKAKNASLLKAKEKAKLARTKLLSTS